MINLYAPGAEVVRSVAEERSGFTPERLLDASVNQTGALAEWLSRSAVGSAVVSAIAASQGLDRPETVKHDPRAGADRLGQLLEIVGQSLEDPRELKLPFKALIKFSGLSEPR